MPGTSFAPPVALVHPSAVESDMTRKKRRQAQRLAELLEERTASKFEGKRPGGGLTNKEKARKKNFLMLRKSSAVQGKLKQSLLHKQRAIRKQLRGNATMDRRQKQRRRRT